MVKKNLFLGLIIVNSLYAMDPSSDPSNVTEVLEQTAREFYPDDPEKRKKFITEGLEHWVESRWQHLKFNKEEHLNPSINSYHVQPDN